MPQPRNPFPRTLTRADLVSGDVALQQDQWVEVGRFTVGAGQAYAIGHGGLIGLDSAVGRLYIDLRDNGAAPGSEIPALVRLDLENPQKRVVKTLFEYRSERLRSGSADDLASQIPLAEQEDLVGEDFSFVLRVRADAAATLGQANTVVLLDATAYDAS